MHEESLSRAEIQSLLGGLAPPEGEPDSEEDRIARAPLETPSSFAPQAIAGLRRTHEEFCRGAGKALIELLKADVAISLVDVQQVTWRELTARVAFPTCLGILEADPLGCNVAVLVSPAILYPMLDRLLGGGARSAGPLPQRPLTEIETHLTRRIMQPLALELQMAWREVLSLALRGERIECDCQAASLVEPHEAMVVIACDVVLEESRGPMQIWIPRAAVEPLSRRLEAVGTLGPAMTAKEGGHGPLVELAANLAETTMTVEQLLNLKPGDIIPTSQPTSGPVVITVEGLPKFHGRVGQHQGRLAVRIEGRITPGATEDVDATQPSKDS